MSERLEVSFSISSAAESSEQNKIEFIVIVHREVLPLCKG